MWTSFTAAFLRHVSIGVYANVVSAQGVIGSQISYGAEADLSFCPETPMPVAAGQQPGAGNELKSSLPIV